MAATPQQVRDAVDTALATVQSAIQTRQASYAASHGGRFWQGRITHSAIPADGATATPDVGTATPTDQPGAPWPAAIRGAALPMAIQVDTYESPAGPGYQVTLLVRIGGASGPLWTRTAQVGPESGRARGWTQVVEDAP